MNTQQEIPGNWERNIPWHQEIEQKRYVEDLVKEWTARQQVTIPDDVKAYSQEWYNLQGVETMPKQGEK